MTFGGFVTYRNCSSTLGKFYKPDPQPDLFFVRQAKKNQFEIRKETDSLAPHKLCEGRKRCFSKESSSSREMYETVQDYFTCLVLSCFYQIQMQSLVINALHLVPLLWERQEESSSFESQKRCNSVSLARPWWQNILDTELSLIDKKMWDNTCSTLS